VLAALRSRRRSRVTLAASLVGVALVLAGCSNPGSVDAYNDDTRTNFLDACAEANSGWDDEQVAEVCGCWYDAISGEDGLSFEEFEQAEDDIRLALDEDRLNSDDDLRGIAPNFVTVLEDSGCVETGPSAG
jgi:hypothetical protein